MRETNGIENVHAFSYKHHFYKQRQAKIGKKSSKW